jgi:hypothetical protein
LSDERAQGFLGLFHLTTCVQDVRQQERAVRQEVFIRELLADSDPLGHVLFSRFQIILLKGEHAESEQRLSLADQGSIAIDGRALQSSKHLLEEVSSLAQFALLVTDLTQKQGGIEDPENIRGSL